MASSAVLSSSSALPLEPRAMREEAVRAAQSAVLRDVYTSSGAFDRFAQSYLWPPEVSILVRFRDDFLNKRVLDVGVGAGRTTRYLADLAGQYTGIDYAESMIQVARQRFPNLRLEQANICDLSAFADSSFDSVFAPSAVLDALSHADRLRALAEIHRVLVSDGLFAFSGHNLAAPRNPRHPTMEFSKYPVQQARYAVRWLRELANRQRYRRFEMPTAEYAILNDAAFEWRALHYYCSRESQTRQLETAGFRLADCLSMDGLPNDPSRVTAHDYKLHYVCRATKPRPWTPRREARRRVERREQEQRTAQIAVPGV